MRAREGSVFFVSFVFFVVVYVFVPFSVHGRDDPSAERESNYPFGMERILEGVTAPNVSVHE